MRPPPPAPSGRRIDLHTHSVFSDGTLTPEALVARAVDRHLAALAVTDHDTLEGVERARDAAAGALELVTGIELSSALDGMDLHILGYYVDPEDSRLRDRLLRFREDRRRRALAIVERLAAVGAPVDPEGVLRRAGPGVVGRPHVAEALVEAGHVESLDQAFRRFLGPQGVAFVPRPAFTPREAIELIHAADGVSVLAHPGALLSDEVVERLVDAGLRGIEVWHPQHSPTTVRRYRALATRLGLVETGGSDFHSLQRGSDLGDVPVPITVLGPLKQAAGVAG